MSWLKGIALLLLASFTQAAELEVHDHKSRDIENMPIPKIEIALARDAMDGVNLHVELQNYNMGSPSNAGAQNNQWLSGHAHLFINGVKQQRLYATDVHIPAHWLKPGVNQIAVSLNSHQHENWTHSAKTIVGSVFFNPEADNLILHQYSSQPIAATFR
ncbi:hypothetical protein KO507_06905 [Gilvimarinus agarilyticus]|nr:hypothetical protein [Gilvimarinus sp. 2_MG-2023]MBU2885486.1 hypothetical protein [Gilvimarinus agarilyticus]MDO6570386.1 hypothetical protein [Gilvimarinus sp. 2_MG-2023]